MRRRKIHGNFQEENYPDATQKPEGIFFTRDMPGEVVMPDLLRFRDVADRRAEAGR